jgi:hypothetical protein
MWRGGVEIMGNANSGCTEVHEVGTIRKPVQPLDL